MFDLCTQFERFGRHSCHHQRLNDINVKNLKIDKYKFGL